MHTATKVWSVVTLRLNYRQREFDTIHYQFGLDLDHGLLKESLAHTIIKFTIVSIDSVKLYVIMAAKVTSTGLNSMLKIDKKEGVKLLLTIYPL